MAVCSLSQNKSLQKNRLAESQHRRQWLQRDSFCHRAEFPMRCRTQGAVAILLAWAHSRCAGLHYCSATASGATASGISLGKILEAELTRGHAATEHEAAVAIIRHNVIARLHLKRDCRQRLVAH